MGFSYYIIDKGEQKGPLTREELKSNGLHKHSYVWREGLIEWEMASNLPELNDLFVATPPPMEQTEYVNYRPYYIEEEKERPTEIPHKNYIAQAIICTVLNVLCSGMLGAIPAVVAIIMASNANTFYALGEKEKGDIANSKARTWLTVGYVILGVCILLSIIFIILYAGFIASIIGMSAN